MAAALDWVELEAQLRRRIEGDWAKGTLVTSRSDLISRKHYIALLNVTEVYGTRKLAHVFEEYEKRYDVQTGPKAMLPEMRVWLEQAYQSRSLEFLGGVLDRKAFAAEFNLKGGSFMSKCPEVSALLSSYDQKAKIEGYLDKIRQADLDRMRNHLEARVPLNKDRLTVNRKALFNSCRPLKLLHYSPAVDGLIRPLEDRILEEARASKIDPIVHGRRWNFEIGGRPELIPFLSRVGEEFARYFGAKRRAVTEASYSSFVKFIGWAARSDCDVAELVIGEAAAYGRVSDGRSWEECLYQFRSHLERRVHAHEISVTSANTTIKALRTIVGVLASREIVPELTRRLLVFKERREAKHLKSIAEAPTVPGGQETYLDFVVSTLSKYRSPEMLGIEVDASGFIGSIAHGATATGLADPSEAVLHVIKERRLALEQAALVQVAEGMKAFHEGRALLEIADINVAEFVDSFLTAKKNKFERDQFLRDWFPKPTTSASLDRSRANFLKLIQVHLGGVFPAVSPRGGQGEWRNFFNRRVHELGGKQKLAPMIAPAPESVSAALTLYLLESGANVEVGRMLLREGIRPSEVHDYISVVGFKARAGGKPIFADIPLAGPAGKALAWLKEFGASVAAKSDDPECIFNVSIGGRAKVISSETYASYFKQMKKSVSSLADLDILPSMLRPSVLLEAALSNDGRLALGRAIGQHSLTVSQGYQQKFPVRLAYEANIHRFQRAVEQLLLEGVPEVARRLGMNNQDVDQRAQDLIETGLGTFCRNALGRQTDNRCGSLSCWDDCPNMVIIARTEAIAWLQIWRESLRNVAGDWERDRPERWEKLWLPWACLIDVVEEQMARGRNLLIWREAEKHARLLKQEPGFLAPQPW